MTDYANDLFAAIDTIVGSQLNQINFDKTLICTIVDDSNASLGRYRVSDGSVRFDAYSDNTDYKIDETVRVSVLNGDTSDYKFIEGRYIADGDAGPIPYVSPLDKMLDMTGNLFDVTNINVGIKASGLDESHSDYDKIETKKCIWSIEVDTNAQLKELQANNVFDTIALQADFKTLLSHYSLHSGNYGLQLDIYRRLNDGNIIKRILKLDSSEMFGDPYSFSTYTTQAVVAEIGASDIIGMTLWLYQDNNFKYYDANKNEIGLNPINSIKDNIFADNIYISLGSNIVNIADNTLQLYTQDSLEYNSMDGDNTKNISILWYNKDENNRYLGFSDGIYDPNYDEITYIKLANESNRLAVQAAKGTVPDDVNALTLAADIEEAQPYITNIQSLITKDLNGVLKNYWDALGAIQGNFSKNFDEVSSTALKATGADITKYLTELVEYYDNVFAAARVEGSEESEYVFDTTSFNECYESLISTITTTDEKVKDLLDTVQTAVEDTYHVYSIIQGNYSIRINKILNSISTHLSTFQKLIPEDTSTALANVLDSENWTAFVPLDTTAYENRYCIYWYRYGPTLTDTADPFMETGWCRLTVDETITDKDAAANSFNTISKANLGLPGQNDTQSGYYLTKPSGTEGVLTKNLSSDLNEEKLTVVLFYNHVQYQAEPLVFTNAQPNLDETLLKLLGNVYIEHSTNSQDAYQLYGIDNRIINIGDCSKLRKLIARWNDLIDDGSQNEDEIVGAEIYWYIPNVATMLTYDVNDNTGLTCTPDSNDQPEEMYMKGYTCFARTLTGDDEGHLNSSDRYFTYRIKDYYSPTFSNNTIICKIRKPDSEEWFTTDITFTFSSYGTSGTDYTLVISPAGTAAAAGPKGLVVDISFYDYNNVEQPLYKNSTDITTGSAWLESVEWEGLSTDPDNITPTPVESENLDETDTSAKDENIISQYQIVYNGALNCYYRVLKATAGFDVDDSDKTRIIELITYYPVPFTTGDYYAEGASFIIYDSYGANPSYYKGPFKLYSARTNEEITDVTWSIVYYDDEGKVIDSLDAIDESYVPKLKEDNSIVPCVMYLEGFDIYPVVMAKNSSDSLLWAQPIYVMQNRYASPMVNSWDGSFTIDEDNGTIMSTMMGAGRKNSKNQFEGILMGDVSVGSADNATSVGLYGYHEGAQSFGFKTDGTAFIGKSGRGRIDFDGNTGTISSASYEQTDAAGMLIDLDDGFIDIRGTKKNTDGTYSSDGTSSNIHLDTISPYFYIDSENGNKLINIGLDGYYLQSDNYKSGTFNIEDGAVNTPGTGTHLNLLDGVFDAYNLKITSKNLYIDSTEDADPFFVIKTNNGTNLIYAGLDNYYLKTQDYKENESGVEINLKNGTFKAYNSFSLTAGSESVGGIMLNANPANSENYLYAGKNGVGYIRVDSTGTMDLLATSFTLKSDSIYLSDVGTSWNNQNDVVLGLGNNFSVTSSGKLTANDVAITGGTLSIGNSFSVTSSGALTASSATIGGKLTCSSGSSIGPFSVDSNSIYTGSWSSSSGRVFMCSGTSGTYTIGGQSASGWCFGAGSAWGVTSSGAMYGNNVNINGGSIELTGASTSTVKLRVKYSNNILTSISPASLYVYSNGSNSGASIVTPSYITTTGYFTCNGDLSCGGSKNRIVNTKNYGQRLLYCIESPSPYFADIGEGVIDEYGECYVFFDDEFAETIDLGCSYQVFLQAYGEGNLYIKERSSAYFVVAGTAGLSFGWEVKAVQLNYDSVRLEEFSGNNGIEEDIDYEAEADNYIESILE